MFGGGVDIVSGDLYDGIYEGVDDLGDFGYFLYEYYDGVVDWDDGVDEVGVWNEYWDDFGYGFGDDYVYDEVGNGVDGYVFEVV